MLSSVIPVVKHQELSSHLEGVHNYVTNFVVNTINYAVLHFVQSCR